MPRDEERVGRIRRAVQENGWTALVCTLPANVLMLSGYWPVIGSAVAIITREGSVTVLAPEDEKTLAEQGWADEIRTFQGGSLQNLKTTAESVGELLRELRVGDVVGYEGSPSFEPSTYASGYSYGAGIEWLLRGAFPSGTLSDATDVLRHLRSVLTSTELGLARRACAIASRAFRAISGRIEAGMREFEIAALLRSCLSMGGEGNERSEGFAYCMSGPRSARAYAAFQQTGSRAVAEGDFILLHCNSSVGGFWTDITRTFCLGAPGERERAIIDAVVEATRKVIGAVRPGVKAAEVDAAARQVLEGRGFGKEFKHAAGHGVGFAAINHNALPRIHPLSDEILEPGMVFNLEPAVYIDGLGGFRQCNMVAVTDSGAELLTDFQNDAPDLILQ